VESEGHESPVADVRRMIIRMFNKLKEELKKHIQKQLNESQKNMDKRHKKAQNPIYKLKEDFNKL
jgi:hypothetical protein